MPLMVVGPYEKYEALVDDEDIYLFLEYDWYFDGRYIKRKVNGKRHGKYRDPAKVFYLHREIMKPGQGMVVDHIDGNILDNRRANLRVCTQHQNNMNVTGKCVRRVTNRPYGTKVWHGKITHNYEEVSVGFFETEEEAAEAVAIKKVELRGEFASG